MLEIILINALKNHMKHFIDPRIKEGLAIQYEVIKALLLREMITRWGRRGVGFLMILLEPFVIISVITIVVFIAKSQTNSQTYRIFGVDLLAFLVTGYNMAYLFRRTPVQVSQGISANRGLLSHRNVRPFDLFFTRYILEMVGITLSFILIMLIFIVFNFIPAPKSYEMVVAAWLLMVWFSFGLCFCVAPIISLHRSFTIIWMGISIVVYFLSGGFYMLDWLPAKYQAILIYNPVLSGMEMIRHGYFGDSVKTYEDPFYLIEWNLALTVLGLRLVRSKFLLNRGA